MPSLERAIRLLRESTTIKSTCGTCIVSHLTPSQVYANIKGYGKAHRYIYETFRGSIPDGVFVCHSCDNPRCVNVKHLFLGTPLDNMIDKVVKGRQTFGGPGPLLSYAALTTLIALRYEGKTYEEIGILYKVDRRTVQRFMRDYSHD